MSNVLVADATKTRDTDAADGCTPGGARLRHWHGDRTLRFLYGSLQYSIQALWTAVQYNLPVVFVVLRNGDYSALKSFCDFTSVGRNVPGIDIPGIDPVKLGTCAQRRIRIQ